MWKVRFNMDEKMLKDLDQIKIKCKDFRDLSYSQVILKLIKDKIEDLDNG